MSDLYFGADLFREFDRATLSLCEPLRALRIIYMSGYADPASHAAHLAKFAALSRPPPFGRSRPGDVNRPATPRSLPGPPSRAQWHAEPVKVFVALSTIVTVGLTAAGIGVSTLWFWSVLRRFGLRLRFAAA